MKPVAALRVLQLTPFDDDVQNPERSDGLCNTSE